LVIEYYIENVVKEWYKSGSMNIKKWMVFVLIIFGAISIAFFTASLFTKNDAIEIIAVTCVTTYFQACLRPLTGSFVNLKYHNKINYNRKWFHTNKFEQTLFKILMVKKWKKFLPTYDKPVFDMKNKSLEEIAGAMCQAEIVHELMLVEAFLPLLLIILYGKPFVFVITSLVCALIDLVFIIAQRYNRPRVVKLIKIKEKRIINHNDA